MSGEADERQIEADADVPDLDIVPGWRPVVEGVRHIGGLADEPPSGARVEMRCGRQVTVPRRRRRRTRPALFDCNACWQVWLGVDDTGTLERPHPRPRTGRNDKAGQPFTQTYEGTA